MAAWSIAAIAAIWHGFPPPLWTQVIIVIAAVYVSGLTLERSLRPRWED